MPNELLEGQPLARQTPENDGDTFADEDAEAEQFDAPEGFRVDSEDRANWLIRKITELRARQARMRDTKSAADAEIRSAKKSETFLLERFGAELEAWMRPQLSERKKSVQLLEGRVGFRKRAAHIFVTDEEAAIAWAREFAPELVNVSFSLRKADLQTQFEQSGEVPPGCAFEAESEVLNIK